MSDADQIVQRGAEHLQLVAAEVGSARLEQAEPDSEMVALAAAFARGELSESDFDQAVERQQQARLADSRQRARNHLRSILEAHPRSARERTN